MDKIRLQERRESLAKEIYSKSWKQCCWKQQDAIDSRIKLQDYKEKESEVSSSQVQPLR